MFVHDRETGDDDARERQRRSECQADGASSNPAISSDGRFVAFESTAPNLVPGDTNGVDDVFVHDRTTGETSRVSVATGGAQVTGRSLGASISDDGRHRGRFCLKPTSTLATRSVTTDVFVRDQTTRLTTRA